MNQTKEDFIYAKIKINDLESDVTKLKADNHKLKEEKSILNGDYIRTKKDFLEVSRKVADQHREYQARINELSEAKNVQIMKDRKLKKEMKKKRKTTPAASISTLTASPETIATKPRISSNAAPSPPPQGLPDCTPTSPRTPPGTPPGWASQPLNPPPCQEDCNKNKYNPIEVAISELKDKIARDSPNFDELVEFVRNSKLSSEDSQEDAYSDGDYENYPDFSLDMENQEDEDTV